MELKAWHKKKPNGCPYLVKFVNECGWHTVALWSSPASHSVTTIKGKNYHSCEEWWQWKRRAKKTCAQLQEWRWGSCAEFLNLKLLPRYLSDNFSSCSNFKKNDRQPISGVMVTSWLSCYTESPGVVNSIPLWGLVKLPSINLVICGLVPEHWPWNLLGCHKSPTGTLNPSGKGICHPT